MPQLTIAPLTRPTLAAKAVLGRLGAALAVLLLWAGPGQAANFSFTGTFSQDDELRYFTFTLNAPSNVTLRTFGYAGGLNSGGQTILAGGFDPVLSLFFGTGPAAFQLNSNGDGGCSLVGADPSTKNCWDSYLDLPSLGAGTYTLVLSQFDNLSGGLLSDAFSQAGQGNFTGMAFGGAPGSFVDSSPAQRNGSWAVDIWGVSSANGPGVVIPEPSSMVLIGGGGLLLLARRLRRGLGF